MTSPSPSSIAPPPRRRPSPSPSRSAAKPSPSRPSIGPNPPNRAKARSTSASKPCSPRPTRPCRSPTCAPVAVSAPRRCTTASLHWSPPDESPRPIPVTASQAADQDTHLDQRQTETHPPTARFRFPTSLQPPGTGTGKFRPTNQPRTIQPQEPSITATTGPSKSVIRLTGCSSCRAGKLLSWRRRSGT